MGHEVDGMFVTALQFWPYSEGPDIVVGNPKRKRCRFCRRYEGAADVSFDRESHVIAATLTGSRAIVSVEECDACNTEGSRHENDLAAWLAPSRLEFMIPGRRRSTHLARGLEAIAAEARAKLKDEDAIRTFRVMPARKGIIMKLPALSFRTSGVARAVLRMGLFLAPQNLLDGTLEPARRWLQTYETSSPLQARMTTTADAMPWVLLRATFFAEPFQGQLGYVEFRYGRQEIVVTLYPEGAQLPGGMQRRDHEVEHGATIDVPFQFAPSFTPPTDDEVRGRAFRLWQASGGQPGDGVEHWVAAERELILERGFREDDE